MNMEKCHSSLWLLMPIIFGLIGGIIAYFVLRKDDPKLAKNCIYLGFALFGFGLVIMTIFGSATTVVLDEYDIHA
ncbi:MAG: putative membrane protein [Cenarchaeum symbiont of Oopsacas minuta]|nr:putative membrane protein [Cenarchaeum symbiont of Oopsacas minuta]